MTRSSAHRKGLPVFRTAHPRRRVSRTPVRHRTVGVVAALALGATVLTGCAAGRIAQTADQIASLDGAQGTVGQIGVIDALLATPDGDNYPKGSQAPLKLWISNDATTEDTLTAITTDVGTVTIDGTATVPPESLLEVGGPDATITATVTGLTRDLNYGISVPMTFSFAHAGDLSLRVPIENPQERVSRPTTNIYPEESPNLWETAEAPSTAQSAPTTNSPAEEQEPSTSEEGHFYTGSVANTAPITG